MNFCLSFEIKKKQAGAELGQAQPLLRQSYIKTRVEPKITAILDVNLVFGNIWLGILDLYLLKIQPTKPT